MTSILDLCLQPVCNRETFFREYFLKKPLHTSFSSSSSSKQNHRNRFDRFFRLTDLEFLWNTAMRVDPQSMLFFHHPSHPSGPISNLRSAFFAFAHQISVVVNKADKLSPAILAICKEFEAHFPFVFCNVYSTPAGERTVPVHVDDRDVFILQVHGSKHWRVYENPPVVLPYKSEELGKNQPHSPAEFSEKDEKVAFEGDLEAGDVLYLPRGFPHVAKALSHSPSVHLTIAVQTSDWDVRAVVQDGFDAILGKMLRTSAVSGKIPENERPQEFSLRHVLPPSLLSMTAANKENGKLDNDDDSEQKQLFQSKLQSSLQLIFKQLSESPEICVSEFHNRLAQKRSSRQEFFDENVASIRFFPLSMNSLVQWVSRVQIFRVTKIQQQNQQQQQPVGNISHLVVLQKQQGGNNNNNSTKENSASVDSMQLSVSSAVLEIMFLWQKHFSECPGPISEIATILAKNNNNNNSNKKEESNNNNTKSNHQEDFSLAAICVAGFLLRNGCLIRVS